MKILLAFDGSNYSVRATEFLIKLLKECPTHTATVIVASEMDEKIEQFLPSSKLCHDLLSAYHKQSVSTMESALSYFIAEGINVSSVVKQGVPSKAISNLAREDGYDLIVMGKRGMSDFPGISIGSVTRQVMSFSHCPVLVVK